MTVGRITFAPTPGPWQVRDTIKGAYIVRGNGGIGDSALCKVLKVSGSGRMLEREREAEANARLIAAAADLLAALKGLVSCDAIRWLDDKGPVGEGWQSDALTALFAAADAAIAKAEGKE
jgi:hypothetical protein